MPPTSSIDVVLSWSRTDAGTTVVLQQRDDASWDEVGRTDGTEFTVEGLGVGRAYVFAAAALEDDGAPEEPWEQIRVAPLADDTTPARPQAPTEFAAQDGANVNLRWDAAGDGVTAGYELRVGDSWEDGTLVAADLTGTSYSWPWWSSVAQTLHLKAIARFERASMDAVSVALTIEPLDDHVTSGTSDQAAAGWPGTATGLDTLAVSQHLRRLRDLALLEQHERGRAEYYTPSPRLRQTEAASSTPREPLPQELPGLPQGAGGLTAGASALATGVPGGAAGPVGVSEQTREADPAGRGDGRRATALGLRPFRLEELARLLRRTPEWVGRNYMTPMLREGIVEHTAGATPTHSGQAYGTVAGRP